MVIVIIKFCISPWFSVLNHCGRPAPWFWILWFSKSFLFLKNQNYHHKPKQQYIFSQESKWLFSRPIVFILSIGLLDVYHTIHIQRQPARSCPSGGASCKRKWRCVAQWPRLHKINDRGKLKLTCPSSEIHDETTEPDISTLSWAERTERERAKRLIQPPTPQRSPARITSQKKPWDSPPPRPLVRLMVDILRSLEEEWCSSSSVVVVYC